MKKIIGALLIMLLIIGAAAVWKFLGPELEQREQKKFSDAKTQGKFIIVLDNFVGYFFLRSSEMKAQMRSAGWQLEVVDDNADYADRMKKLAEGKYHFAVATVDSYILNAASQKFPAMMGLVIDESAGADCILARADKVSSLDAIRGNTKLRVAFTPNSPSEHFGKATAEHFNVPELIPAKGDKRRIETNGSEEAVKKLLSGATDIAICWEPDVSKALANKGIIKLLGTESTTKLIVDIGLFPRELVKKEPQMVKAFYSAYFKTLKHYRDNSEQLRKEVKIETKLSESAVDAMLKGVRWVSLEENCNKWFGISVPGSKSETGLLDTIESTVRILINAGDFKSNPLPDKDPARITYSSFLEELYTSSLAGFTVAKPGAGSVVNSLEVKFSPLSSDGWKKLKEVGTLKMSHIIFSPGSSDLNNTAKEVLDETTKSLQHYPSFRILVKGHTAPEGDEEENQKLSRERAEAVARYLNVVFNIDSNRLRAVGLGSSQKLRREPDETNRAWYYRLARVELILVREEL